MIMDLLAAALPEFLGSLAAALVISTGHWAARRIMFRLPRAPQATPPVDGDRNEL